MEMVEMEAALGDFHYTFVFVFVFCILDFFGIDH